MFEGVPPAGVPLIERGEKPPQPARGPGEPGGGLRRREEPPLHLFIKTLFRPKLTASCC